MIMIRPITTAPLILLLFIPVYTQERVKRGFNSLAGPRAVWNPSEKLESKLYSCCNKPCFATIMRKAGTTEQAITFSKSIEYRGWLTSFSEMGRVDVATVYHVCMVNSNAKVCFLMALHQAHDWGQACKLQFAHSHTLYLPRAQPAKR